MKPKTATAFFVLVFALSIPCWLLGGVTKTQIMPGLPVSALAAICPLLAAVVLVSRWGGWPAALALLRRSFDYERIRAWIWYVPVCS